MGQLQNEAAKVALETKLLVQEARLALETVNGAIGEIRTLAVKLGEGIETVNTRVLSEENLADLSQAFSNFESATESVQDLGGQIEPTLASISTAFDEVKLAAKEIRVAAGSAGPAFEDMPEVLASIEKATDEATAAIKKVQDGEGALGALAYDRETKEDLQSFIKNLKKNGILRYRDEELKEPDPRDRFRGRRR